MLTEKNLKVNTEYLFDAHSISRYKIVGKDKEIKIILDAASYEELEKGTNKEIEALTEIAENYSEMLKSKLSYYYFTMFKHDINNTRYITLVFKSRTPLEVVKQIFIKLYESSKYRHESINQ